MNKYERDMIPSGLGYTVAVSGGIDSIGIAHYLATGKKLPINVWHFNHKLRPQNDLMEDAVRRFCVEFNIPLIVNRRKESDTKPDGESCESFYRDLRLKEMYKITNHIILGHHLNDCVESHILNFLNGKEMYAPMPVYTPLSEHGSIIRPFLLVTKRDILDHCRRFDLERFVVADETNACVDMRRNWVRHDLIPTIETKYPGLETIVKKKVRQAYDNHYLRI